MLPSGYSGLEQVRASYREVTVCYSRVPSGYSGLEQFTEWLQWVTAGYSRLPSGDSGLLFALRVPTAV